ncbi:MAG: hypothetical protein KatS3mg119_1891 [Rhodothalassiaceae bacterium]|nr:MAG: hypothetical protein KatS3mg119_1891 [Rhodothalassiaceae bacterium]
MAWTSRPAQTITMTAAAALTKSRFVTATGAVPAAGAAVLGVTESDAPAGGLVPVITLGTALVTAGAAITAGQALETDAAGQAVPAATGTKVAVALTDAAAGELVEAFLTPVAG